MIRSILLTTLLLMAAHAQSEPARPDHYEGLTAETLAGGLDNLREYNHRLEFLIDGESLSTSDLNAIHQLTYTLENALERIAREVAALADTLEEVHVASEQADAATVREQGRRYLDAARPLQQQP